MMALTYSPQIRSRQTTYLQTQLSTASRVTDIKRNTQTH